MDIFENTFVYFGGGGGYEIPNQIVGYRLKSGAQHVITPEVAKLETGEQIADYLQVARDVSDTVWRGIDVFATWRDSYSPLVHTTRTLH